MEFQCSSLVEMASVHGSFWDAPCTLGVGGRDPATNANCPKEVQRLSLPNLNSDVVEHQMYMYGAAGPAPSKGTVNGELKKISCGTG